MNTTNLSTYVSRPILVPSSPYFISNKAKVAKSYTVSHRHNRRGIENLAYSLYSTIFDELTSGVDTLVPQVNASVALVLISYLPLPLAKNPNTRSAENKYIFCSGLVFRALDPIRPEFKCAIEYNLGRAIDQLMLYAAAVFTEYGGLHQIAGVVTAGVYWSWAVIKEEEVPKRDWQQENNTFLTGQPTLEGMRNAFGAKFARIYEVGTPESDEAFTHLRDTFLYAVATSDGDFAFK